MFSSLFRPSRPDVASLKKQKDIRGLIKALKYGERCFNCNDKRLGPEEYEPVVVGAALALAEIGDPRAIDPIVDAFFTNGDCLVMTMSSANDLPHPNNPLCAILPRFGKDAVEPLLNVLNVGKGSKSLIAMLLGCIGDARAAGPLIQHAADESTIWALGNVGGGVEAVQFLMRYLVDDNYCHGNREGIADPTRAFGYGKFGTEAADMLADALAKTLSQYQMAGDDYCHKSSCAGKVERIAEALCELCDPRGLTVMLQMWGNGPDFRRYGPPQAKTLYVISKFQDARVVSLLISTVQKYTDGYFRIPKGEREYDKSVDSHRAFYAALGLLENGDTRGVRLLVDVAVAATDELEHYRNYFSPDTMPQVAKRALILAGSKVREPLTVYLTVQDNDNPSVVRDILDRITEGTNR